MKPLSSHLNALSQPGNLDIGDVGQANSGQRQPAQILLARLPIRDLATDLGVIGLQRPGDEGHKAARPLLQLVDALQVLDAMLQAFPHPEHHGGCTRQSQAVGDLHDLQPLLGVTLVGVLSPDLIHQDLGPAPWNRVQSRGLQPEQDFPGVDAEDPGKGMDLRRREAVEVDPVPPLQLAQEPFVPLQRKVGMEPALHENAAAAKLQGLLDFFKNLLVAQDVTFAGTGRSIKSAKGADRRADVAVVDVAVHHVGDDIVRMQPTPDAICRLPQLDQGSLLCQEAISQRTQTFFLSPGETVLQVHDCKLVH